MSTRDLNAPPNTVGEAIRQMFIIGIWKNGPRAIGIVLCGAPLLGLAAVGYFVLGSVPIEVLSGASGIGVGTVALTSRNSTR